MGCLIPFWNLYAFASYSLRIEQEGAMGWMVLWVVEKVLEMGYAT